MIELIRMFIHTLCGLFGGPCHKVIDLQQDNAGLQNQLDYINHQMQIDRAKTVARADRRPLR